MTPLHYAVQAGNLDITGLLIEKHAEINVRTAQGETALHISCKAGNFELVRMLTKLQEIFVDIEDSRGNTPLHYASMTNNTRIVGHLTKVCKANPCMHNFLR